MSKISLSTNKSADVILIRKDRAIILQVRDDIPTISNPGCASTFGGHIEPDEEPIDAALREVNEETNLSLRKDCLAFYALKHIDKENYGLDLDIYYYLAKDIDDSNLKVFEGAGHIVVHNEQELSQAKPTRIVKEVVEQLLSELHP